MKKFLLIATVLFSSMIYAQDRNVSVKIQSDTITISLDDDNHDKSIYLHTADINTKDDIIASVLFWKDEQDWKRRFIINDENGSDMTELTEKGKGIYCKKLSDAAATLEKGKTYFIYTAALPRDPQKAMLVKVPRVLVCKLVVD